MLFQVHAFLNRIWAEMSYYLLKTPGGFFELLFFLSLTISDVNNLISCAMSPGSEQSSVFYHHCQLKKVEGMVEGLRTGELPEVLSTKTVDAVKLLRDFFNNIKVCFLSLL